MTWRFWRWLRTDDLVASGNIEDRRCDPPKTYKQILTDWWYGPKEGVPVTIDPASKLSHDLGIGDINDGKGTG